MKTTSVWVVALAGEHVFHEHVNKRVITDLTELDLVRASIKEQDKLEFDTVNSAADCCSTFYKKYNNITDNRDIYLIVERSYMTEPDLDAIFKEKAQYYFGRTMAGLNCKPCDYRTFKKWYDDNHTCEATYEIYLVAQWVWNYYEPNF
jgi:hypothetical protein